MVLNYFRAFSVFFFAGGGVFFVFSFFFFKLGGYYVNWGLFVLFGVEVGMTLVFDWVSCLFLSFVLFISSGVMFYSEGYMLGDGDSDRFCFGVFLFVLSMLLVIVSPNLISILLGWDGLGLVSYWLVIYYQNYSSYSAGMLTVMSNRVGDVCLLVAICFMLDWGSWEYEELSIFGGVFLVMFSLCILAAMTKGAQIPFSAWLPAAMAAPTPVSSLVHSSTLVTAGVYLLVRFEGLVGGSFMCVLMVLSCATMFMAGVGANFEFDLSSVIALSTLSQVGLMLFTFSLGYVYLAFFHLLCHAGFKCLLFLCAGSIIHGSLGWQDLRMMGGMVYSSPFIGGCIGVANLALCGFPFLSGFYSSEGILECVLMGDWGVVLGLVLFLSIGLTACYSVRLVYYLSIGSGYGYVGCLEGDGESSMNFPIFFMTAFSVFLGGSMWWFVFPLPCLIFLPLFLSMLGVLLFSFGVFFGLLVGGGQLSSLSRLAGYFGSMWYLPDLSGEWAGFYCLMLGGSLSHVVDGGWGGFGVFRKAIVGFGLILQWGQNNMISLYLFTFFSWVWGVFWFV